MGIGNDGISAIGGISGLLQGYVNQRNLNQQNAFEQQKLQNTQNETALKGGTEGFQIDPTTGALGVDPTYGQPGSASTARANFASQAKLNSNPKFIPEDQRPTRSRKSIKIF